MDDTDHLRESMYAMADEITRLQKELREAQNTIAAQAETIQAAAPERQEWQREVVALRKSFPYCEKHKPNGGTRSGCLECAYIELNAALSRISYLCGEPNEMEYSSYDADYDAQDVVRQVETLRRDAERWRAMRQQMFAVDWMYGDPPTSIVAFRLHSAVVGAGPEGADNIADATIEAQKERT